MTAGRPLPASASIAELRVTQCAGDAEVRAVVHSPQRVRHQERRHLVVDRPVRHFKRSRAGIEERARQTGQAFAGCRSAGTTRVARRQHHKVGVEIESDHLGCGQQRTRGAGRPGRCRRDDRRIALAAQFCRKQRVSGELQNAIVLQLRLQHSLRGKGRPKQFVRAHWHQAAHAPRPAPCGHRAAAAGRRAASRCRRSLRRRTSSPPAPG